MSLRRLYSVPAGLLLGIALALLFPAGGAYVAWLGQVFISLLKLLILPLILVSIFASLASGDDLRRIGGRTLLYYAATSAVAATIGTLIGLAFSQDLPAGLLNLEQATATASAFRLDRLIDNFIPSNLFASLTAGNVLHIVFVAVFAAAASRRIAKHHRVTLVGGAQALDALLMQALNGVLAIAPLGIAALVYASLATMDWAGVFQLRSFVWAVGLAAVLHALVVMPALYRARTGRAPLALHRGLPGAPAHGPVHRLQQRHLSGLQARPGVLRHQRAGDQPDPAPGGDPQHARICPVSVHPVDLHVPVGGCRGQPDTGGVHRRAHHGLLRRHRRHPQRRHRHDGLHARSARPARRPIWPCTWWWTASSTTPSPPSTYGATWWWPPS